MKRIRSVVRGVGSYLPERVVTNRELSEKIETSHEWIVQRTGIEQRHIAAENETTSWLGIRAARAALVDAGMTAADCHAVMSEHLVVKRIDQGVLLGQRRGALSLTCREIARHLSGEPRPPLRRAADHHCVGT